VIIEAGPKSNLSPEDKIQRIKKWQTFGTIRAVKNNDIHFIGADYILIPGPRLLSIVDQFARAIHPDRFTEPLHTPKERERE
jgi:iron complex transport system substrate-binding protein